MELAKFLENKAKEVENLKGKLSEFVRNLESMKGKSPPRWSGDVKDLNKFVQELDEWIKSPKVKRAKDLIEELKKYANDHRSFKGLGEDYFIKILDDLERAVRVLSKIENKQLKENASMKILDKLQEEEEFSTVLQNIENYWKSFNEFEKEKMRNEFLKVVKEELIVSLAKSNTFSLEEIRNAKKTLKKASDAVELLVKCGISAQSYIKAYETSKSVDKIWEETASVRRLLEDTNIQFSDEVEDPFREIKEILDLRDEVIKKDNLFEIKNSLEDVKKRINDWREKIKKTFTEEYYKTKSLVEFAELENKLEEILNKFEEKLMESSNVSEIYAPYRELLKIKSDAINKLEDQFSEAERKIIENIHKADELVDQMGDEFWNALKNLRRKGLIKITIARGT